MLSSEISQRVIPAGPPSTLSRPGGNRVAERAEARAREAGKRVAENEVEHQDSEKHFIRMVCGLVTTALLRSEREACKPATLPHRQLSNQLLSQTSSVPSRGRGAKKAKSRGAPTAAPSAPLRIAVT